MRIVAGNAVRGEDFFDRESVIKKAWDLIESGNHLLIAAPRRVGKTSVMFYLLDHPTSGYTCTYLISESVNNNNSDDPSIYRYNSPILRMWWRQNVAN